MRIMIAVAAIGVLGFAWLAQSTPTEAYVRHAKQSRVRTTIAPYPRSYGDLPPPGYTIGGPNYTACDRMNHDRMLYGRRC